MILNPLERNSMINFSPKETETISKMAADLELKDLARRFFLKSSEYRYSYNFSWLGRPIIQFPQDIIAIQEIIWEVKPDLIVETGIAHGGSIVFSASILELMGGDRKVIGVDIDIRPHNRIEIEKHPLFRKIVLIEGSSIEKRVVDQINQHAKECKTILVILDSMHTHSHVLKELELYAPLVRKGSYVIVLDTIIEDMPPDFFPDRPWGKGNNAKTAVTEFLNSNDRFQIDKEIENKLLITVAPGGYLKCIKD